MKSTITKIKDNSCQLLNNRLFTRILELTDEQIARKTHYFDGRYENIYVDIETIDELKTLVKQAKKHAAEILEKDIDALKIGFWINIMHKGHTTSLHSHEDADELLSGVYYVSVPENSGQFIYYLDSEKHSLEPEEGSFLFFSPALLHEVTKCGILRFCIAG
ncbi:MAG: putative 2OG-Fe(II) oxygenase [Gammaproteobacteria bacterium]